VKRVLGKMEQFLESIVEGVFSHDADSLPAAILKRLAHEIEHNTVVKGDRKWAPSECRILLTRDALRSVLPIMTELEEELRAALARLAEQSGLSFSGPLKFKFAAGDKPGIAIISAHAIFAVPLREEIDSISCRAGKSETGPTKVFRHKHAIQDRAWLHMESGQEAGREYLLIHGRITIGRLATSHVNLNDPNVSRSHASIAYERGKYRLADLGSTNGTFVNGKSVKKHLLKDKDMIKIGRTLMVFHWHQSRPQG